MATVTTAQPFEPATPRLAAQLAFLTEIDKLKLVQRRSPLMDSSRRENSAEHSWHVAMAAITLAEYAEAPVDVDRVVRMLLIHDIVEIDAGDTFAYDSQGRQDQASREEAAAARLYGLLPDDQVAEMQALWREFDARESAAARFAHAIDRLLPVLHNFATGGGAWRAHGVHRALVAQRMEALREPSPKLWTYVDALLDEAVARGYLSPDA